MISKTKNLPWWEAEKLTMNGPYGKQALQENWARSLVLLVMERGNDIYDHDIVKVQQGRKRAVELAKTLNPSIAEEKNLLELWWTMQAREQQLIDRYNLAWINS